MIKFFDMLWPAYIENWPNALHNMSLAQADIPMTIDEHKAILMLHDEQEADVSDLIARINEKASLFPEGFFPRLGSRSPKDSMYTFNNEEWPKHRTGKQVIDSFMGSMRVWHDLNIAAENNYKPHVFLREWRDIPEWAEFRCFIHERKLIGISQYHYLNRKGFAEILQDKDMIENAIRRFVKERFIPESHLDSVVCDVFLDIIEMGNQRSTEVKLLEINPFFEKTDPCLFSWVNGGDFDGKLRILTDIEGQNT